MSSNHSMKVSNSSFNCTRNQDSMIVCEAPKVTSAVQAWFECCISGLLMSFYAYMAVWSKHKMMHCVAVNQWSFSWRCHWEAWVDTVVQCWTLTIKRKTLIPPHTLFEYIYDSVKRNHLLYLLLLLLVLSHVRCKTHTKYSHGHYGFLFWKKCSSILSVLSSRTIYLYGSILVLREKGEHRQSVYCTILHCLVSMHGALAHEAVIPQHAHSASVLVWTCMSEQRTIDRKIYVLWMDSSPWINVLAHTYVLTQQHRSLLFVWGYDLHAWASFLWSALSASNVHAHLVVPLCGIPVEYRCLHGATVLYALCRVVIVMPHTVEWHCIISGSRGLQMASGSPRILRDKSWLPRFQLARVQVS